MTFELIPEEDASPGEWVYLPLDDSDHEHEWERLTTPRGVAYRCTICWDRTD